MNMYIILPKDELSHYGVKGMKWGVRHEPVSMGGRARRALAGVYGLNERTYRKLGNNTLASMNASARKQQLQKAAAADAKKKAKVSKKMGEREAKKLEKANRYKVDVSKAKNSATRRVAEDTHRLNDLEFQAKYKTTKKTFAKRYKKTGGDTFSLGRKKQALAIAYLELSRGSSLGRTAASIAKYDSAAKAEQKLLDNGRNKSAYILNQVSGYDMQRRYLKNK